MHRTVLRINTCQVKVGAHSLVTGTIQQSVRLSVNSPAHCIALALMEPESHSRTFPSVAAVFRASGRAVVACGDNSVILHDDSAVFPLEASAPVSEDLGAVKVCVRLGHPGAVFRDHHISVGLEKRTYLLVLKEVIQLFRVTAVHDDHIDACIGSYLGSGYLC